MASEPGLCDVIASFLQALEAGQAPDRTELLARHPDLAAELAAFLADHDKLQGLARPALAETATAAGATPSDPGPATVRCFGEGRAETKLCDQPSSPIR